MKKYIGLRFTQAGEKTLLTFVAPAEEIRLWSGIPHKTTDFVGGFQRPLNKRYEQIIDYFDNGENASPTAIVVAFRPGACVVTPLSTKALSKVKELKAALGGLSYGPELVTIEIDEEASTGLSLRKLAKRVRDLVGARAQDDSGSEEEDVDGSGAESEDVEIEEDVPTETAASDDWGVDVGKSALHEFAERLKDDESIEAFVNEIAANLPEEEDDEENAGNEDMEEEESIDPDADTAGETEDVSDDAVPARRVRAERQLRRVLESLLRPAMIVDGQHRIWGAAESSSVIPFTVCALENADWREQVFQFVVINKQARAISGELLASIVNSSLTNREIEELEDQLESAGISTYESKILRALNDDPDSPFQGLVSRGLEENAKKITFKAAIALASRWKRKMTDRDPVYRTLFRPTLPGSSALEKQNSWEGVWKKYMFAFWNAVKNLYKAEQLWEPGTQLMYRATLEGLQDNFLNVKATSGESYATPIELREAVEEFYRNVPAGFFHTTWKRHELLTEDGRKVLEDALNAMRVPSARLKKLVKTEPLFTGGSTARKKRRH